MTAKEAILKIKERAWEHDIPSPCCPEYRELHEDMQDIMNLCDELLKEVTNDSDTVEKDSKEAYCRGFAGGITWSADIVRKRIAEASEKGQRPHVEWIPCAERLPENDGTYLITRECFSGKGVKVGTSVYVTSTQCFYPTALAWKPLPEPYERGDEK